MNWIPLDLAQVGCTITGLGEVDCKEVDCTVTTGTVRQKDLIVPSQDKLDCAFTEWSTPHQLTEVDCIFIRRKEVDWLHHHTEVDCLNYHHHTEVDCLYFHHHTEVVYKMSYHRHTEADCLYYHHPTDTDCLYYHNQIEVDWLYYDHQTEVVSMYYHHHTAVDSITTTQRLTVCMIITR